jgi:hypothetical protein
MGVQTGKFTGTGGSSGGRGIPIAGTFCEAFLANGITLTGPTSIDLRIECTNPDGSKTAYVKIIDGPNNDLSNFQEISQY